jgi:hypothetical protein
MPLVCSSSILAETLGYAVSFSSPRRGKRRVFEWCKPVLMDQLQPSTNADKLSDRGYKSGKKAGELSERTKWCEPERTRKAGDMSLECLKLFLEGASSSWMEKKGIKSRAYDPPPQKDSFDYRGRSRCVLPDVSGVEIEKFSILM